MHYLIINIIIMIIIIVIILNFCSAYMAIYASFSIVAQAALARIQFYVGKSYGFVVSIINLSSQYTYDCIITSIYIELIQPIMFSGVSAA